MITGLQHPLSIKEPYDLTARSQLQAFMFGKAFAGKELRNRPRLYRRWTPAWTGAGAMAPLQLAFKNELHQRLLRVHPIL